MKFFINFGVTPWVNNVLGLGEPYPKITKDLKLILLKFDINLVLRAKCAPKEDSEGKIIEIDLLSQSRPIEP